MNELLKISFTDFQLSQEDFFVRLLITIGIGCVIGLEREYISLQKKVEVFAGVRTFVFFALTGFMSAFLGLLFSEYILILGFISIIVIIGISYWMSSKNGSIGGTTETVAIITFLLGITVLIGFITESLVLTVVVVTFLSLKGKFKSFAGKISQEEIYAFMVFATLAFLVLPFLPDTSFGPYGVVNPKEIGWIILLTSGLGFAGYILMKFFGTDKGILLTGIIGGLVSSTAVTWVFSKKSKENPELSLSCAVAILAASTIMILRVLIWVYIFNPSLLKGLVLPLLLIFFAGLAVCIYYYLRQKAAPKVEASIPLGDPLNLKEAVIFGIVYTLILIIVSYANETFGEKGILLSSAIAGLTDIDAITISISKLAGTSISITIAQTAIILAALCNTIVKVGIVFSNGSNELKRYAGFGYGAMFVAGIVAIIIINV